jgi:hypothetical protein
MLLQRKQSLRRHGQGKGVLTGSRGSGSVCLRWLWHGGRGGRIGLGAVRGGLVGGLLLELLEEGFELVHFGGAGLGWC